MTMGGGFLRKFTGEQKSEVSDDLGCSGPKRPSHSQIGGGRIACPRIDQHALEEETRRPRSVACETSGQGAPHQTTLVP